MAAPVALAAGKIAVQVVASGKGKQALLGILTVAVAVLVAPILLVTGFFGSLAGWLHLDPPESPYRVAELQLIEQLQVENTLDVQAVKVIDLLFTEEMDEDAERIAAMVEQYFLKTVTIGEGEEAVTVTLFLDGTEMEALLPLPPFSFDTDKMEAFRLLSLLDFFLSPEDGTGDSGGNPGTGSGGFTGKYPMPLTRGTITSGYGDRTGSYSGFHDALDLRPPNHHAPVLAIASGEVVTSTVHQSYGNYIKIRHTDENGQIFYTLSAHLSKRLVSVGDLVSPGQTIGLEGGEPGVDPNPGDSTGHHLHFEVRLQDRRTRVNPATFLRGWG